MGYPHNKLVDQVLFTVQFLFRFRIKWCLNKTIVWKYSQIYTNTGFSEIPGAFCIHILTDGFNLLLWWRREDLPQPEAAELQEVHILYVWKHLFTHCPGHPQGTAKETLQAMGMQLYPYIKRILCI